MDEKKNNTTERPAFKAPENAPVRRVGTLTLGVCLIVCGVLFLCYFFVRQNTAPRTPAGSALPPGRS